MTFAPLRVVEWPLCDYCFCYNTPSQPEQGRQGIMLNRSNENLPYYRMHYLSLGSCSQNHTLDEQSDVLSLMSDKLKSGRMWPFRFNTHLF